MKRFLATLTIALLAVSGFEAAYAKDSDSIHFGVDPSYAPFESKSADGKLVGFDIDLGDEICKHLHAKCVWVENDFDGMIPALKARKFDGILSSMMVTPKRAQEVSFSDKLYAAQSRLIVKRGSPLQPTAESLAHKKVGVQQGTVEETYAKTYWGPKGVEVIPYQNQDLVYADLKLGRLDASLQDGVQASLGFLKTPNGADYTFSGASLKGADILGAGTAIGLRKGDDELRGRIDDAISAIRKDGTYDRLQKKYFDFDIYN
ncbi:ABC transporter substrate-binding protein [Paraburkholderia fungorum]|uniref:ABC transporter substrate-binding protein n=1 Tax=Paraburkholderia fungorum TaxID=134537 RepID=UPI0038B7DBA9